MMQPTRLKTTTSFVLIVSGCNPISFMGVCSAGAASVTTDTIRMVWSMRASARKPGSYQSGFVHATFSVVNAHDHAIKTRPDGAK
jgi:hypothetical protein